MHITRLFLIKTLIKLKLKLCIRQSKSKIYMPGSISESDNYLDFFHVSGINKKLYTIISYKL